MVYPASIEPLSPFARMSPQCITNDFPHDSFYVGRATNKMDVVVLLHIQMFLAHWVLAMNNSRQSVGWGWRLRVHVVVNIQYSV